MYSLSDYLIFRKLDFHAFLYLIMLCFQVRYCLSLNVTLVYEKFSKGDALLETITIFDESSILYSNPRYESNSIRRYQTQLDVCKSGIVTVRLGSKEKYRWSYGSHILFYSEYGSYLIDVTMDADSKGLFRLFMIYPLYKLSVWEKRLETPQITQKISDWYPFRVGNFSVLTANTIYLRKNLTWSGLSIAYQLNLFYRYGIIVYINNKEIMRDNLPSGPITSATHATGGYRSYRDFTFIRNANDFFSSSSSSSSSPSSFSFSPSIILSVELHWPTDLFLSTSIHTALFDAYLIELPQDLYSSCYLTPFTHRIYDNSTDFNPSTSHCFTSSTNTYWWTSDTISYQFNMLAIQSPYLPYWLPQSIELSMTTVLGQKRTRLMSFSYYEYQPLEWNQFNTQNTQYNIRDFQLKMNSQNPSIYLQEFRMGICMNNRYPEMKYIMKNEYLRDVDWIDLMPTSELIRNCTIIISSSSSSSSLLPSSLSFNHSICRLYGYVVSNITQLNITITSHIPNIQTVNLSLILIDCQYTHLTIHRRYSSLSYLYEWVNITDHTLNHTHTLFQIPPVTTQSPNSMNINHICVKTESINIDLGCDISTQWDSESFIELFIMINNEQLLILHTRFDSQLLNHQPSLVLSLKQPIRPFSIWKYHTESIPFQWYAREFNDSHWLQSRRNEFNQSVSQYQFFRHSFNVTNVNRFIGIQLFLRYRYCYIIYINGLVVQSYGINDEITNESVCDREYENIIYRSITLRLDSIREGNNVISVCIISDPLVTQIEFDIMLLMLIPNSMSRSMKYSTEILTDSGIVDSSFLMDSDTTTINYLPQNHQITQSFYFLDNRRESFNCVAIYRSVLPDSVAPVTLQISGRNSHFEPWVVLVMIDGMVWRKDERVKLIYVHTVFSVEFIEISWGNQSSSSSSSSSSPIFWSLAELSLLLLPPSHQYSLQYSHSFTPFQSSLSPIYPKYSVFSHFSSHSIPSTLLLDSATGAITGNLPFPGNYSFKVTATHSNGLAQSVDITLQTLVCNLSSSTLYQIHLSLSNQIHSLTVIVYADKSKQTIISSTDYLTTCGGYYLYSFCLPTHEYYISLRSLSYWDSFSSFWITINGLKIIILKGHFMYQLEQSYIIDTMPLISQNITIWRYKPLVVVPSNWNTNHYKDTSWSTCTLSSLPRVNEITTYFRHSIIVSDHPLEYLYQMELQYEGGIVLYIGGFIIAKLNLPNNFDSSTRSNEIHSINLIEIITINLVHLFVSHGSNVLCIEYHKYSGQDPMSINKLSLHITNIRENIGIIRQSSLYEVIDYGYNIMNDKNKDRNDVMNDSFSQSIIWIKNSPNVYLLLKYNRLVPIRSQGIMIEFVNRLTCSLKLYGQRESNNSKLTWELILDSICTGDENVISLSLPQLLLGYSLFRLYITTLDPIVFIKIRSITFIFNSHASTRCPAIDNYLPAWNHDLSVIPCLVGYTGYRSRQCIDGRLSEPSSIACILKEPSSLLYSPSSLSLIAPIDSVNLVPTIENIAMEFTIQPELPNGIIINVENGVISGIPVGDSEQQEYTITAGNSRGVSITLLTISSSLIQCKQEGEWPEMSYRINAMTLNCGEDQNVFGIRRRQCQIDGKEAKWGVEEIHCYSISLCVILLTSFILIGSVCLFQFIACCTRRKRIQ